MIGLLLYFALLGQMRGNSSQVVENNNTNLVRSTNVDKAVVLCYPLPCEQPRDVPPIQELRHQKTGMMRNCKPIQGSEWVVSCEDDYYDYEVTTCADKSMVLLTAEDGSKHCVRF